MEKDRDKRDNTMAEKLMNIPNDDTQNFPFCKLQLVVETFGYSTYEPTNQNLIKIPKVERMNEWVKNVIKKLRGLV